MKFINTLTEVFKRIYNLLFRGLKIKYNFSSHLGFFLLYNSPFIVGLIVLFIFFLFTGDFIEFSLAIPNGIKNWFYSGYILDTPMWRIHLAANILIFIYLSFNLEE